MIYSENTKKALYLLNFVTMKKKVTAEGIIVSLNPILVAEHMPDENTTLVALLHPVIKSGVYTITDLEKMEFPEDAMYGLKIIFWDKSIPYKEYLQRIKTCPIAMVVKLAEVNQIRQTLGMDDKNYWRYLRVQSELEEKFSVPFRARTDVEQAKAKIYRNRRWRDRCRGVMIGGAIGDALGYPVTNLSLDEIREKCGEEGITEYILHDGKALISSVTQSGMFTANGILRAWTSFQTKGFNAVEDDHIYYAYKEMLDWQYGKKLNYKVSWVSNISEMGQMRLPDMETINALEYGRCGSLTKSYNSYQGCGGMVRVAPIALYHKNDDPTRDCIKFVAQRGASVASITHGDPLGYLPAAMLTHIISRLIFGGSTTGETLNSILHETKKHLFELFGDSESLRQLYATVDRSLSLAANDWCDATNIARIGMGYRADEILGIALYCCVKYPADFDKAIITATNHDGDSSASAAVTGMIMGAMVGYEEINQRWKDTLELHDVLLELADDLTDECQISKHSSYQDEKWKNKYADCTFRM